MSVPQKVLRTEQWMQMSEVRRPIIRGLVFIRFTTRGGKKRRWARSDRGPRVSQIVRVTVQGLVKIKYDCRTEKNPATHKPKPIRCSKATRPHSLLLLYKYLETSLFNTHMNRILKSKLSTTIEENYITSISFKDVGKIWQPYFCKYT